MVDNPVRHSLVQRSGEIRPTGHETAPEQILRYERFLEETRSRKLRRRSGGFLGVAGITIDRRAFALSE